MLIQAFMFIFAVAPVGILYTSEQVRKSMMKRKAKIRTI